MKKLIFISCIAIITTSCKQKTEQNAEKKTASLSCKQISLNGIPEDSARKMIDHFDTIKDSDLNPLPETVWISQKEFQLIVHLLEAERDTDIAHKSASSSNDTGVTDGMRIYFACDASVTNPHNTTSIILVATKDYGPSKEITDTDICFSGRLHKDNYQHCLDSTLFTIGNTRGKICTGGDKCKGDSLYLTSKNPSDKSCGTPHSISRAKAERMVHNFKGHSINTKSEWFDLCYLESLAQSSTQHPNQNGIRIYFATRDFNPKLGINPRDAFIIVPTISKDGAEFDDFICPPMYTCKPYPYHGGGGDDNGELCPANCKP